MKRTKTRRKTSGQGHNTAKQGMDAKRKKPTGQKEATQGREE